LEKEIVMDPTIFREYDIRGIVDKDISEAIAVLIGKGFGSHLIQEGRKNMVVGRDNRLSSKRLMDALIEGAISAGLTVIDLGQLPTPALYFSVIYRKADSGVMITASHNPPEYNGFKLRKGERAVFGEEIQKLREIIQKGRFEQGKGKKERANILPAYTAAIKERIKLIRAVKVVIDAGNGTTGPVASQLLKEMGCDVVELYCEPDGNFPHHLPDPTVEENLVDLSRTVRETKAEIGIGYDGDGDRVGAVDEQGNVLWGDQILTIFAREVLKKRSPAPIVLDVKCSQSLIDTVKKYGGTPIMWRTGYPHIQSKMREINAPLGGEMSGHMYFADNYFGYDDGIFASCRLLEIISHYGEKGVSHLLSDIPTYPSTPEIRTECSEADKFKIVQEVKEFFSLGYKTIDIDGVRIIFDDGWALIRASNTQPLLVLRFEAKTQKRLEEIKNLVRDKLKSYPSVKISF
jgi:phosphomannomutase/phosphoglucomutase